MKVEAILMHKILNFIYNKNIDVVKKIFEEKVESGMLYYLVNKAENYSDFYKDNTKAWIAFIGSLDGDNSDILINYILYDRRN